VLLDRIQAAAHALNLSTSAATVCAAEGVADAISNGWIPKRVPSSGPIFLAVHVPVDLRGKIDEAATSAGIKRAELSRIAVWAALSKMEGREQVLWPFRFTKKDLNEVVRKYSEDVS